MKRKEVRRKGGKRGKKREKGILKRGGKKGKKQEVKRKKQDTKGKKKEAKGKERATGKAKTGDRVLGSSTTSLSEPGHNR